MHLTRVNGLICIFGAAEPLNICSREIFNLTKGAEHRAIFLNFYVAVLCTYCRISNMLSTDILRLCRTVKSQMYSKILLRYVYTL